MGFDKDSINAGAIRMIAPWALILLLSVPAVAPLTHPGYFWGAHDARHSVYFLLEFDRSFRDGVLYPRWMPDFNFGYGYPFFNIYSPGAFYLSEFLHLAGMDLVTATKVVFGLGLLLSGLTMYLYSRRLLGTGGGLVAAIAYVYIPYHLVDVYVRAALAESLAFVFFPLVLWAFHRVAERNDGCAIALAALALAGLIFSHYGMALIFIPFLIIYLLLIYPVPVRAAGWLQTYAKALAAGVLGLGLCAILLLPAFLEYSGVRTDQWAAGYYDYREHFVYFFQLFSPLWDYGISIPGPADTMPFQLGVVPVVMAILSLFTGRRAGPLSHPARRIVFFSQAAVAVLIFLMLSPSALLWELLRLAAFVQFPWRLLAFTVLPLAFLCGVVAMACQQGAMGAQIKGVGGHNHGSEQIGNPRLVPWLALLILASYPYLSPKMLLEAPEGPVSLGGLMRFQQSANEMTGMTAWATAPKPPGWSPLAEVFADGKDIAEKVVREGLPDYVQAVTVKRNSILEIVKVRSPQPFTLRFYTAYYPGWRAWIDGQEVAISIWGDYGGMAVAVPAGDHTVELRFGDTPPRSWGAVITLVSLAIVLGIFWKNAPMPASH